MMIVPKTDKQILFVQNFILHGNASKAARDAGYGGTVNSAKRRGHELKLRYKDYIAQQIANNISGYAPAALEMIAEIARNGESEAIRLKAAIDLMDRAGFKPTTKTEQKTIAVEERSTEELEEELKQLGYH